MALKHDSKPQGVVNVVGVKQRTPNKISVFADIILQDESGQKWRVSASRFVSDLKPYCEEQELEFGDWHREVCDRLKWNASADKEDHFPLYMEGLSVEEAVACLNNA